MTFSAKKIVVTFGLQDGTFPGTSQDTLTLSGLRVIARISQASGPSMATAHFVVYGMTLSQMNKLSTLGLPPSENSQNRITISAGDASGLATVFTGNIQSANVELSGAPESGFAIESYTGAAEAAMVIPPTSYRGNASVAMIIQNLARQMGRGFENSGVAVSVSNPYFAGSARDQVVACVKAANIEWYDDGNTISIWPNRGQRTASAVIVSADTGMIGYPTFCANGIVVRTVFNPNIVMGRAILVVSILPAACGTWAVYHVDVELDSETPGGSWFQTVTAYPPNQVGTN